MACKEPGKTRSTILGTVAKTVIKYVFASHRCLSRRLAGEKSITSMDWADRDSRKAEEREINASAERRHHGKTMSARHDKELPYSIFRISLKLARVPDATTSLQASQQASKQENISKTFIF